MINFPAYLKLKVLRLLTVPPLLLLNEAKTNHYFKFRICLLTNNTYPSVTNKLKSAQNRAVKAVFRLPRLYPTKDLYSDFGIIPFEQIIKKLNLSLAYSAYHKNLPPHLLTYFNSNNSEGHCLRSSNRSFIVPRCISSSAQRSPIYKSIIQWNVIPSSVELSTSFRTLYNNVLKS